MTYSNLEKLAYQRQLIGAGLGAVTGGGAAYLAPPELNPATIKADREMPKESAWRDLPHLARGVMSNLREHTFPELKQVATARERARILNVDPEYINSAQPLRERAKRVADLMQGTPMGDARRNEAIARLVRMHRAAGNNEWEALFNIYNTRVARQWGADDDPGASEALRARLRARKEYAWNALRDHDTIGRVVLDADKSSITSRARVMRAEDQSKDLRDAVMGLARRFEAGHPIDADFMQRVGAKPLPQVIGKHVENVIKNPHYMMRGLRPVVLGTPGPDVPHGLHYGAGAQVPLVVGGAIAPSQQVLAHELGHATGVGALMTLPLLTLGKATNIAALRIPEELRAQMRGQDIMREWQQRGAASGLPAELSTMTPEQLKEHTLPLSTYADLAARQVFNATLDARDAANDMWARVRRAGNRRGA